MTYQKPSAALVPEDEWNEALLAGALSANVGQCLIVHDAKTSYYGVVYRGPDAPAHLAAFEQMSHDDLNGLGASDEARDHGVLMGIGSGARPSGKRRGNTADRMPSGLLKAKAQRRNP